jgi:hypothetical protein
MAIEFGVVSTGVRCTQVGCEGVIAKVTERIVGEEQAQVSFHCQDCLTEYPLPPANEAQPEPHLFVARGMAVS